MESKILYTILVVLILFLLLIEYKRISNKEHFISIKGKNVQAMIISELFSEKDSLTMDELREKLMSKVDKYFNLFKLFHGKKTVTKEDIQNYLQ